MMLDSEIIEGELFGVKSSNISYGHRMESYDHLVFLMLEIIFVSLINMALFYTKMREEKEFLSN